MAFFRQVYACIFHVKIFQRLQAQPGVLQIPSTIACNCSRDLGLNVVHYL